MTLLLLILAAPFAADAKALGADDWRRRDAAERRLAAAGWRAWPAVLSADRTDPERAARLDRLAPELPTWDRLCHRFLFRSGGDWCDPAEAAWWAGSDNPGGWRAARLVAHCRPWWPGDDPWCQVPTTLPPAEAVLAFANYARSVLTSGPLQRTDTWETCARPPACPSGRKR